MSRAKLPVVKAGIDWAVPLGGRLGRRPGDLSHHAVEATRSRLRLALICFALVFAVLAGRLAQLTLSHTAPHLAAHAETARHLERPIITDRNGVVLATQITTTTLGADAAKIDDGAALAAQLKNILPKLNAARAARLMSGKARYVTLLHNLTPAQKQAVLAFGNPALKLTAASTRVYPAGEVAGHAVGFTSSDMRGLAGLERHIDGLMQDGSVAAQFVTSLDVRVQHVVRDELLSAMQKFKTKAAGAILVDVHNGEIVSLVSLPDFDANAPLQNGQAAHFNRITYGTYELGSIFKVFTAAMALDSGLIGEAETFDTSVPLKIGRFEIKDTHPKDTPLSVDDIVIHSSNIGSAQLALRVSDEAHFGFLQKLGFVDRMDLQLPELAMPQVPRWTQIERVTSSYGHGISVTPLHAVMAGAAMVNGGVLYQPSLQKVGLPVGERVIAASTSAKLRRMMRAVVASGTGGQADVPGYDVLGKTGSAEKSMVGGYDKQALVASFLGAFPEAAPRYAMLVMLDEPQGLPETYGHFNAGWNAAPTFANIVRRAAPLLGVLPHVGTETQTAHQLYQDLPTESEVAYAP